MKNNRLRNHRQWLQKYLFPPCSATLHRSEDSGVLVHMCYESDRTFMWEIVLYDEDKDSGNTTDFESRYMLDTMNTAKLMMLMAAHDGYGLLNAIKNRFGPFQADSSKQLMQFCDVHGVVYNNSIHRN